MVILHTILKDWRRYMVMVSPLGMMWLPFVYDTSEGKCAYVILLMAIFYMTEALPLAVTALMPVFAFPLLGIISTDDICRVYMRGTAMMFFGGLAIATAVEHCNLHKRIALFVILKVGQSPRRLMGSFMMTTMFLSMFISNTAATAMIVPILDAILQELYKKDTDVPKRKNTTIEMCESAPKIPDDSQVLKSRLQESTEEKAMTEKVTLRTESEENLLPLDKENQALSTMFYLATAYASNIGGTGFPTGAGPNLVFWGILQSSFPEGTGLNFATWMAFNIPGMIICVCVTWIWLETLFMGCFGCRKFASSTKEKEESIKRLVQKHYESLGRISFHEICVATLFSILVLLWFFRAPEFVVGWAELVQKEL